MPIDTNYIIYTFFFCLIFIPKMLILIIQHYYFVLWENFIFTKPAERFTLIPILECSPLI